MTGAQVFARACKEEGVAALFCCPGNYTVVHAIASAGIPAYRRPPRRIDGARGRRVHPRHRRARDCSGHRGAGLHRHDLRDRLRQRGADAAAGRRQQHVDQRRRTPKPGIQLGYQQPTTEGLKKYGKRLIIPRRVHEYAGYAFRQLRSGVPKPVHLDFPSEVAAARFKDATELEFYHDETRYRTDSRPHPSSEGHHQGRRPDQDRQRPIIVSSNGVFYAKAWDALKRLAEKAQIPVVESGAMKGQFSDASPLSANAVADRAGERGPRASSSASTACRRSASSRSVPTRSTSASIRRTRTSAATCRSISAS